MELGVFTVEVEDALALVQVEHIFDLLILFSGLTRLLLAHFQPQHLLNPQLLKVFNFLHIIFTHLLYIRIQSEHVKLKIIQSLHNSFQNVLHLVLNLSHKLQAFLSNAVFR